MSDGSTTDDVSTSQAGLQPGLVALSYTTERLTWWRQHRRGLLIVVLLIGFGVLSWHWGSPAYQLLRLHLSQIRALRYQAPADHVVYHEVETTGQRGQTVMAPGDQTFQNDYNSPATWFDFAKQANLPFGSIVFLGSRDAGKGERIIYLRQISTYGVYGPFPAGARKICLSATVLRPGGWISPPADMHPGVPASGVVVVFPPARTLRVMAGQIDARDAAHFTVRCSFNGDDGKLIADETLDCFLLNDDTVQITPCSSKVQIRSSTSIP